MIESTGETIRTDNGDRIHVLFVHREMDYMTATAIALRRRGFAVNTASNAAAALMAILRECIDVVVLDVRVPGIFDDDLFTTIHSRWTEIPVLILNGHGDVAPSSPSTHEGVVDHLASPCEVEKLAGVLRVLTAKAKALCSEGNAPSVDPSIRVLIVDDEQEQLDLFSQMLDRRGMKIDTATDGRSAVELLSSVPMTSCCWTCGCRAKAGSTCRRRHV